MAAILNSIPPLETANAAAGGRHPVVAAAAVVVVVAAVVVAVVAAVVVAGIRVAPRRGGLLGLMDRVAVAVAVARGLVMQQRFAQANLDQQRNLNRIPQAEVVAAVVVPLLVAAKTTSTAQHYLKMQQKSTPK